MAQAIQPLLGFNIAVYGEISPQVKTFSIASMEET